MSGRPIHTAASTALGVALLALYLLHNDLWAWNDPTLVLGLPVGLAYHVLYCLAAAGLFGLCARFAWPSHLEAKAESPLPREDEP